MIGERFGRLVVLSASSKKRSFVCLCDCGQKKQVQSNHLKAGRTKSCGCLARELTKVRNATHGHARVGTTSKAYKIWAGIRKRCLDPNSNTYSRYGGRGITICERWMKFENFLEDMGQPPDGMSIERKDNDGPYCKENCRWATRVEQGRNKRNNVKIEYDGKKLVLSEWSALTGLAAECIARRLKRGWSVQKALTTPSRFAKEAT